MTKPSDVKRAALLLESRDTFIKGIDAAKAAKSCHLAFGDLDADCTGDVKFEMLVAAEDILPFLEGLKIQAETELTELNIDFEGIPS